VSTRLAVAGALVASAFGFVGGWAFARLPSGEQGSDKQPAAQEAPRVAAALATRPEVQVASTDALSLVVVDRTGQTLRTIAANRPWTPRFSPDGRRVAYGAFGPGRGTSDLWVTDLDANTTQRLTDDDLDSNDPQWSPDGTLLAYSVSAPGGKDVASRPLAGGAAHVIASRPGTQFPSDWARDGSALIVTDNAGAGGHDILLQPTNGSPGRAYVATGADETTGRVSPSGHWIAYTSDVSGRPEVYLDSYPRSGRRIPISPSGGLHPVWRADGRELYYWHDDALVAVQVGASRWNAAPTIGAQTVLFRAPYQSGINTMYDASPDGQRFVIVEHQ
jgi:Tol biopolymer transport system component